MGVLGGLLLKKPMFYDSYRSGVLYREFLAMEDIRKTEKILNEIIAFDDLFSKMTITPTPIIDRFLTYKNLILTIWAGQHLGLKKEHLTLSLDEFDRFFDDLWEIENQQCHIGQSMKDKFLTFLSDQTGQSSEDISQKLGYSLENLFNELENEYGKVARKDLDPRYIHLFLVDGDALP